jgi:hypothetical protein
VAEREGVTLQDESAGTDISSVAGQFPWTLGKFETTWPSRAARKNSARLAQSVGISSSSFALLSLAMMNKSQAASSNQTFLDDGVIKYKDLEHGVFELVTKEANPRSIVVDDPVQTIILGRRGSSISEEIVTNSVDRMVQLQADQQIALQTFSLGLQQGPTTTGPNGSSTSPAFLFPTFVQPISFTQDGGPSSSPDLTIDNGSVFPPFTFPHSSFLFIQPPPQHVNPPFNVSIIVGGLAPGFVETVTLTDASGDLIVFPGLGNGIYDTGLLALSTKFALQVDVVDAPLNSLTVNNPNEIVMDIPGGDLNLGASTLTIQRGTVELLGGSFEAGTINLLSSGELSIQGNYTLAETINNNGLIEVVTGQLKISGPISGSGHFQIDNGAVLQIDVANALNVVFTGTTGELILTDPLHFTGTISSSLGKLSIGDQIDLPNISPASAHVVSVTFNTGVTSLAVSDGAQTDTLKFLGNYLSSAWVFSDDGSGGTIVADPPASQSDSIAGPIVDSHNNSGDIATFLANFTGETRASIAIETAHLTNDSAPGMTKSAMSVSIGGLGNDSFIYQPNEHIANGTVVNLKPAPDSFYFDGHDPGNETNLATLLNLNGPDTAHGHVAMDLGHGNNVTNGDVGQLFHQHLLHIHLNSGVA